MSDEQGSAAASKAAAARAEGEDNEPRTVEYEGLTLVLADGFPEEIFFDMIESEASAAEGNGNNAYLVNLRILRSLVGEDQFIDIRHKVGRDSTKVMGLLNVVLEQFGMTMGESDASPAS